MSKINLNQDFNKNKFSKFSNSGQLFCILLLSGAWSVICVPALSGTGQILGSAAGCLMQILLCLPMLALARQSGSFEKMIKSHKILGICYILFFLLWGAQGFLQLWDAAPAQLLPTSGKFTAAVLITLTCLYTSSCGLRATARSAPFVMGLFLLSIAVLILGAWKRIDLSRIDLERNGFWDGVQVYNSLSGELVTAFVLLDKAKTRKNAAMNSYLLSKAGFCILILFLSITVNGRLSQFTDYPFFMLTTLSQPLQGQRADALYILVFVMLFILHITLQTGVVGHLVEVLFPALNRYAAPASLAGMLLFAWFLNPGITQGITSTALPVLAFLIPLFIRTKQFAKSIRKQNAGNIPKQDQENFI
ncbi:MAG: hypothetical protein K2H29_01480 [Oscillospiraceae bacterium]|nr:hypothetical protein [Oscillospiraceae bacterium]